MGTNHRRVLLFTGDGKGKTTAALGMALRASGHGLRTLVLQFIKSDASTGEINAARHLPGVTIIQAGRGFVPRDSAALARHAEAAQAGLQTAAEALASKQYDLVILDEICTAVAKGLLDEARVAAVVTAGNDDTCVVLTGRDATPGLLALADTATEMCCLRHGYQQGWKSQKGVEY